MKLLQAIMERDLIVTAAFAQLLVTEQGNFFVTTPNGRAVLYDGPDEEEATKALLMSAYEQRAMLHERGRQAARKLIEREVGK